MQIDLNCDLGEGAGNDTLIMPYITSANIACGGHAGTFQTMLETSKLALKSGVKIGAHPGYPDLENFGRVSIAMNRNDLYESIIRQIASLAEIVEGLGSALAHVKPHGALYNDAARNIQIAQIIADAVFHTDPHLILVGLSGSVMHSAAQATGLKFAHEVFADRSYTNNGQLVPRSQPNAMITDTDKSLAQVRQMLLCSQVDTITGTTIPIQADTVCIHGDHPHAPSLAQLLSHLLLPPSHP
jgi:UPF0271 protein